MIYTSWCQGLFTSTQSTDQQPRIDRNRYIDLMLAGIDPIRADVFTRTGEKGIDIAMATDTLQTGLEGKIDVAVSRECFVACFGSQKKAEGK